MTLQEYYTEAKKIPNFKAKFTAAILLALRNTISKASYIALVLLVVICAGAIFLAVMLAPILLSIYTGYLADKETSAIIFIAEIAWFFVLCIFYNELSVQLKILKKEKKNNENVSGGDA